MKKRKVPRIRKQPTQDEIEERTEFVMELEAQYMHEGQIKRMFREKYGDVSHVTINDYRLRARARMKESANVKPSDVAERAMAFYKAVIRDPCSTVTERIKAQERMDKIFGIEAPSRSELSGVNGGAIQIEQLIAASELTPDDVKRALAQAVVTWED